MNDRSAANLRENYHGNQEDEHGGSYYVTTEDGEKVMGPYASAAYAETCRDRCDDSIAENPKIIYKI